MKIQALEYLNNLIPKRKQNFISKNIYVSSYNCRTVFFKSDFFPASLEEWFHLDPSIRNSETINVFKQKLLPFILPLENSIFNISDPEGLKLPTRLCLGFSHLNEHRFRNNFQECLNPLCTCHLKTENTSYYLLHCHHNNPFRTEHNTPYRTYLKNVAIFFQIILLKNVSEFKLIDILRL